MASKIISPLSAKLHAVDLISNPKPLKYKAGCELDSNQDRLLKDVYLPLSQYNSLKSILLHISVWLLESLNFVIFFLHNCYLTESESRIDCDPSDK